MLCLLSLSAVLYREMLCCINPNPLAEGNAINKLFVLLELRVLSLELGGIARYLCSYRRFSSAFFYESAARVCAVKR